MAIDCRPYIQADVNRYQDIFLLDQNYAPGTVPSIDGALVHEFITDKYIGKFGVAVALENSLGEIFIARHKEDPEKGVSDGDISIISETMKLARGTNKPESVRSVVRWAYLEEQGIELYDDSPELEGAKLSITRENPLWLMEWSLSREPGSIPPALALVITIRANEKMVDKFLSEAKESEETYKGEFVSLEELRLAENCRPGFKDWLKGHVEIVEPGHVPENEWIDFTYRSANSLDTQTELRRKTD